jgi:hypothetical protein
MLLKNVFVVWGHRLLKESSKSAATETMDVHGCDSIYMRELSMTMGQAWRPLKQDSKLVNLALKYGDYERVEHLKQLISYIRSGNEEIW